jgi:hypothetical protein
MVFGVMIPFSRILCCLLLLFFVLFLFISVGIEVQQSLIIVCLLYAAKQL